MKAGDDSPAPSFTSQRREIGLKVTAAVGKTARLTAVRLEEGVDLLLGVRGFRPPLSPLHRRWRWLWGQQLGLTLAVMAFPIHWLAF